MKEYQCIIFDCDGVLVDSQALSAQVLTKMVHEIDPDADMTSLLTKQEGASLQRTFTAIASAFAMDIPEDFETTYRKRTSEAFSTYLQPIPGIKEVLDAVNLPKCVASSGPQFKIRANLKITGLNQYFGEHIFSAYDIRKWKPDPGVFLLAAEKMGFEVEECLVIEDTNHGVAAALSGGFDVVRLERFGKPNNPKANYIASQALDILKILD